MNALLLVVGLLVPRDTILVELYLVPTAERITVEAVEDGGLLFLPTNALRDLLGVQMVGPQTRLDQLRRAYPSVVVQYQPDLGRVVVFDELGVLPAVRKFREQHRASAFGTAAIPLYSGPFGAFTVDDRSRAVAELGYLYRGRAAVFGRVDDRGAGSWNASAAPIPNLFVGAQGGTGQRPSVNGRVQAGPVWVLTTYVPDSPVQVAGLVRLGRVQTFASREFGMVTISPWSQLTVQLARRWADHSTAGRISFGPTFASPFTFPVSSLSH